MAKAKIPFPYIYVYCLMKKACKGGNIISRINMIAIMRNAIRVPVKYKFRIIDEMQKLNMIQKVNRDVYRLLPISIREKIQDAHDHPLWG